MVGESQTTSSWGSTNTTNGFSTWQIRGFSSNVAPPPRDLHPWENRLNDLKDQLLVFKDEFNTHFRGGLIPHKGYSPWQPLPEPKKLDHKAKFDLRQIIQKITTPRPHRHLALAFV